MISGAPFTVTAPAKLNLCLHIVGRRTDCYHLLESLIVFTDCSDMLHVVPSNRLSLTLDGEFAQASGDIEDNLVMRAARLLQPYCATAMGADITLTKNIPVGAGLGGGSADAAAVLHALNQVWQLNVSLAALVTLAAPLGADVAMCLHSKPLIARGIGDVITPCEIPGLAMHAVLVYPPVKLLSAKVYQALAAGEDGFAFTVPLLPPANDFTGWLARDTRNDLQSAAIRLAPEVAEVLSVMEATTPIPELVRMTGSGSCCFALFTNADAATQYADTLAKAHPQWWVRACSIRG